ncbi:uncharacterized protein BT62DRAFT_923230 [Guyanagaster necrorhizus]|uniref:Uncharacterized protein n=1 Tax=Guyanagaster necrorhizus TaxID=856835 RepID=A0A9P8AMV9_9AGAR|nr:uncharacterized protein BT62DRAFT_923230 [Guyanagaster necrorhizus MCA 3950]KAG7441648.1 hypothetical protein BT62DRAFT_923230 [Guyanagaster necrorhizus MCA 3950]
MDGMGDGEDGGSLWLVHRCCNAKQCQHASAESGREVRCDELLVIRYSERNLPYLYSVTGNLLTVRNSSAGGGEATPRENEIFKGTSLCDVATVGYATRNGGNFNDRQYCRYMTLVSTVYRRFWYQLEIPLAFSLPVKSGLITWIFPVTETTIRVFDDNNDSINTRDGFVLSILPSNLSGIDKPLYSTDESFTVA